MSFLTENGIAVGDGDDIRVRRQMEKKVRGKKVFFGFDSRNDWFPEEIIEDDRGFFSCQIQNPTKERITLRMGVPGKINLLNGIAAIAAAYELGADPYAAAETLSRFVGAHRRFEKTDDIDGVEIYHDYGHNPVEMRNALEIARKQCKGRLWAVMQPHTFSRVRTLFDQYLTCTEKADFTLVTDICAAREADPGDLNSGMLVEGMKKHGICACWTPSFDETEIYLRSHWHPGDLVLTMGCGDINLLNEQIHRHESERKAGEK